MRFANPAGWWFTLALIPVLAVHILRPRRDAQVVSSTFLWRAIEQPVTAARPFRRLRPSWLLLLQVLAVVLLAATIANPVTTSASTFAPHTVFLVDASGSMLALDGAPDRLADARERAIELRRELPEGGLASVVEIGTAPRVLLSASGDLDAFAEAVGAIRGTNGRADFVGAFALASGLETADAAIGFVLLSDGGLDEVERRAIPPGTRYEQVGRDATNRGIVALDVEARPASIGVAVTVTNFGGPAAIQTLRIDVDGRTRERVELRLPASSTVVHQTELGPGDRVEVFLEGEDLLPADNRRTATVSRRQAIRVAMVGTPDPFLEALLSSIEGVELIKVPGTADNADGRSEADGARDAADDDPSIATPIELPADLSADLLVFSGVDVPEGVSTPFLAIRPPGGAPGITVVGEVDTPIASLVRADDPLLQGVDLTSLAIATAQRVESETAEVLIGAEGAPLLLRDRTASGTRFAYLSFAITDSNLPLQVAFPLLGDRLIAELSGAALPPAAAEVGDLLSVPPAVGGVIIDPGGVVTELPPGSVGLVADRPGVWTVAASGAPAVAVAVNPAASESRITPVPSLPIEIRQARPGEQPPVDQSSLRPWFIAALALVLLAEYLLARRHVGVRPWQWRLAVVARAVVALALLGAVLDLGVNRSAGAVATVFVVDGSDSMGTRGRGEALELVREALADQPSGSRAAVVLFGGDARIEVLLSETARLGQPTVSFDTSRTDLAGALRLGGAIAPSDARRRVVLISDGRATEGDAVREAELLGESGIAVDTILVDTPSADDVAVAVVRTPSRVSVGELIPIDVEIVSTVDTTAVVTLRRDGEVVDTVSVQVAAGRQSIGFTDVADSSQPRRYQVEIASRDDQVSQNNFGFAATDVVGAPRVLLVEGATDNAATLAAALAAGALEVDVVAVGDLPTLDRLVSYSSIVLVDVPETQLTARQVDALAGAVRDAGRGLVTIGGDRSYGMGGYYTTELERLLPVVSEILDPQRRQTVAQVLAIDSSGSMGACHCAEGQAESNQLEGGVLKTDIARAAAARTISALGEFDEVGVLAFDVENRWVIDLQQLPPQDVVTSGLSQINPAGGTNPSDTLSAAAAALRASQASLKHIILFTDGFASRAILADLADEAAELAAEGITVSVVATGEGASPELIEISEFGNGRFYPGRDLQLIPEIIMNEAIIASRDFITEGEFLPRVTSASPVVAGLTESPPLLGYVATTAKPTASSLLRIGPDDDPLLATWQIGLGTATSWTSDASARWSQNWASWDGYVGFWSTVVRDTFPIDSGGTSARIDDGVLRIRVETSDLVGAGAVDGATATVRITDPTLRSRELTMDRVGADVFVAEVPADAVGTYLIGTSVTTEDGQTIQGSTLASQSYSAEYRPGAPDPAALARVAAASGGRAEIEPSMAFDAADLRSGNSRVVLAAWLLALAVIAFAIAVVLSRFTLATATVAAAPSRMTQVMGRLRGRARAGSTVSRTERTRTGQPSTGQPVAGSDAELLEALARERAREETESATISALLERTRAARRGEPTDRER